MEGTGKLLVATKVNTDIDNSGSVHPDLRFLVVFGNEGALFMDGEPVLCDMTHPTQWHWLQRFWESEHALLSHACRENPEQKLHKPACVYITTREKLLEWNGDVQRG